MRLLLELNDDIIIMIFKLLPFNFRLINNQCKEICNTYNLSDKIFIFQSISILKLALRNDYKINNNTFSMATEEGNLEIMKWLKNRDCPFNKKIFIKAAKNGNLINLQWLYDNKCSWGYECYNACIICSYNLHPSN